MEIEYKIYFFIKKRKNNYFASTLKLLKAETGFWF